MFYMEQETKQLINRTTEIRKDQNAVLKAFDKLFCFSARNNDNFLIYPQKHTLWVLIRRALPRSF